MAIVRQTVQSFLPPEWEERLAQKRCPVCGIERVAFEPGRKRCCSPACQQKYAGHFQIWAQVRARVLARDKYTCQAKGCGLNVERIKRKLEREKVLADKENLRWIKMNADDEIQKKQDALLREAADRIAEASNVDALAEAVYRETRYRSNSSLAGKLPCKVPNMERELVLEVHHINAIADGGDMWAENNLETRCFEHHKKKTREQSAARRRRKKEGGPDGKTA